MTVTLQKQELPSELFLPILLRLRVSGFEWFRILKLWFRDFVRACRPQIFACCLIGPRVLVLVALGPTVLSVLWSPGRLLL